MKKNNEIAGIFYLIAEFLEIKGIGFRSYAYTRAGLSLEAMDQDIEMAFEQGGRNGLKQIPGIGESLAKKIEEFLKTGKIQYYENLKKSTPVKVEELTKVRGLGPKKIKILYEKLGIRTVKHLKKAGETGKIALLPGFGKKAEQNILQAIEFLKASKGRFLINEILPIANEIQKQLQALKQVKKIAIAGSFRRGKETIGDLDFLIVANKPQIVMDYFCSMLGVVKIWSKGETRSSIRTKQGVDVDLRVVSEQSYGAALQYFTGSVEHNIVVRKIAMSRGMKLNEYGLFRGKKRIAGKNEKEIYKKLGMDWPAPEIRENNGEIGAALKYELPKLVGIKNIKGDLHCHSNWSDGAHPIKQMAQTAIQMGYEYLGISDHTKFLKAASGLNEKQLAEQKKEIDKINKGFRARDIGFRVLHGAEVNILKNGAIDIKDSALEKLDYVIAGIHSDFPAFGCPARGGQMPKNAMTQRIIRAMQNPNVDIIAHPFTRVLKRREPCKMDFYKILRAAKQFGVILEINGSPVRLDLNDKNIRLAKQAGVKMIINSDAHHKDQLGFMQFGVSQARRGWAEKKDIINTRPLKGLLRFFQTK